MKKIVVFIPLTHAEEVKNAMFLAGAGKLGSYSHCSFEVKGIGQFLPLKGAQPFLGQVNELEKVEELKVEMVCEEQNVGEVLRAMIKAHPYETPAYDLIDLEDTKKWI